MLELKNGVTGIYNKERADHYGEEIGDVRAERA
jgi:hypothetical protein